MSTVLKIILKILDIESGFVVQLFEATKNLAPMGVLCILVNQNITGSVLSSYVTFKYVFGFELEIPTSAKS